MAPLVSYSCPFHEHLRAILEGSPICPAAWHLHFTTRIEYELVKCPPYIDDQTGAISTASLPFGQSFFIVVLRSYLQKQTNKYGPCTWSCHIFLPQCTMSSFTLPRSPIFWHCLACLQSPEGRRLSDLKQAAVHGAVVVAILTESEFPVYEVEASEMPFLTDLSSGARTNAFDRWT